MTRLKNTLAEDLIAAKKDVERLSEHNVRLNKEKEELTKERGNLVVDLTGTERDNHTLNSVRISLSFLTECLFSSSSSLDYQCSTCRVSRESSSDHSSNVNLLFFS